MAEGLLAALEDRSLCTETVRRARSLYERKYAREAYVGKMRRLLEGLHVLEPSPRNVDSARSLPAGSGER
jgi:hypothetical protein